MISIEELKSNKYRVKKLKNSINFYSNKDSYLIINNKLKKTLKKENIFKLNFLKKLLIKKNEKFLSIKMRNDKLSEKAILKLINSIKYGDLFELKNISNNKLFLIIIKNDLFEDNHYKDIIKGFKKYKICIDEINYLKPDSNILLETIDENVLKYKIFLIFYEDKTKDIIYKILKDCGEIKKLNKTSDYFVFNRRSSKIVVFHKKRYYKIIKEIIKEKIWKLQGFYWQVAKVRGWEE